MNPSRFRTDDYMQALQGLMPSGQAWAKSQNAVQSAVLRALARSYRQSDADALALLRGAFPGTVDAFLPEWEATLNLPDPCVYNEDQTTEARQRAVVAKLTSTGALSRRYYTDVARALGFIVSITEYRPFRAGMSGAGQPLNHGDWRFTWCVTVISPPVTPENYDAYQQMVCTLTSESPSETLLIFSH
ncbi:MULTISPECIES: YmfQ family protein [Lelliottia]|uniref:Phage tail protein n=2 Tax=Lelliottia aquatilis TaxID=2080838 RepID=A0ABX5A2U6_9ENTR|nr:MULTISPECIES: putative phage tail protein [Lelliottia]POZ24029.1 phage tail protein [Lelliottia aquatilis]POZ27569.1 phage tail protein [Lelliottia sp. 7254-16]POZ29840.1 phage tail protein [Lelliottia aquatilis]POZ35405.1 phage tail protein [Lelliottia aquatilis]POZ38965.1 phage tail protein [Lelliottia aquatilis]